MVTTYAVRCNWCHKEYATNAKLLQHYRKEHPEKTQVQMFYSNENNNAQRLTTAGQINSTDNSSGNMGEQTHVDEFEPLLNSLVTFQTNLDMSGDSSKITHQQHQNQHSLKTSRIISLKPGSSTFTTQSSGDINEDELITQAINGITPTSATTSHFIIPTPLGVAVQVNYFLIYN